MNLGPSIDFYMDLAGLKQTELADIVGMNQGNLSRIINGRCGISLEKLEAIPKACGVRVSEIIAPQRERRLNRAAGPGSTRT